MCGLSLVCLVLYFYIRTIIKYELFWLKKPNNPRLNLESESLVTKKALAQKDQ